MITNHHFMGNTENGSQEELEQSCNDSSPGSGSEGVSPAGGNGIRKKLIMLGAALGLASCGAEAADKAKSPEPVKMAAVERVVAQTSIQCLALGTKAEKMDCLRELNTRADAEIAAIDKATETERKANDQRRTINEVLSNEVEGLKKVVAMQEEPTR